MQGLTLIGSGWHPYLFRAEIKALTGPLEVIHPRVVYIPHTDSAIRRLSRAALLDQVLSSAGRIWLHSSITDGELAQHIAEWAGSNLPEGSFAVRARNLGTGIDGLSRSAIEADVGAQVMSEANPVDLESPEHEIVVVLAGQDDGPIHRDSMNFIGPKVVWGLRESAWQRESYAGRAPTERPFFRPVSLDARQARLLISLAHRAGVESATVVDPFCGTGGIAIEAALQGMEALASDLDGRMVEGTRQNLDWAGVSASVEECAVADVASVWGQERLRFRLRPTLRTQFLEVGRRLGAVPDRIVGRPPDRFERRRLHDATSRPGSSLPESRARLSGDGQTLERTRWSHPRAWVGARAQNASQSAP